MAQPKIAAFTIKYAKEPESYNGKMKQSIKCAGKQGDFWVGVQESDNGWITQDEVNGKVELEWWQYKGKYYAKRASEASPDAPQAPPAATKSTKSTQPVQSYPPSTADAIKCRGVALSYCIGKEYMDLAFITPDEKEGVYGLALEIAGFMLTGKIPGFAEKYNIPTDDGGDDGGGPAPTEEECPI